MLSSIPKEVIQMWLTTIAVAIGMMLYVSIQFSNKKK